MAPSVVQQTLGSWVGVAVIGLIATSSTLAAQETAALPLWEVGVFTMGVSQQAYPGADQQLNRALLLPYAIYRGEVFRADRSGVGVIGSRLGLKRQAETFGADTVFDSTWLHEGHPDGIACVLMGAAKDIVEQVGVPRFVFSDFPLGNAAARPNDVASQDSTLALALHLLDHACAPRTTVQNPLRWPGPADWRLDYMNPARLTPDELARRRAENERSKAEAQALRDATLADGTAPSVKE